MDIIKRRIAHLLGVEPNTLIVVPETNNQYIITTSDFKNYVYSEKDDIIIDFDSLSNKDKTSDKYLTASEKEDLYLNNQGLIGFTLNKISIIDGIELEELRDVCNLGFAKALSNFNKNEGIKFSTYCVRCMLNELYYYLRKEQKKIYSNISFDKELKNEKDGTSIKIGDLIDSKINGYKSIEETTLNSELRNVLLDCIRYLEEDEQYLIIYRYGLNDDIVLTQTKIAEHLNMSQANISKLEKTCLKKLRILMKRKNYVYNARNKTIEKSAEDIYLTGADEKYNYLDKNSDENIALIACERLKINIEEIDEIKPTNNSYEFIVTFHNNNRIYGVVNNITTHVELKKKDLSKNDRFMELILKLPTLYIPTRLDIETDIYNINYNVRKLKKEINKLTDTEKYIITHIFGILNTEQFLTNDIANKLNLTIEEVYEIRKNAMKTLIKKFNK